MFPGMTDADIGRIPVRSRHQAMDWSLVLASQSIEVTIDHSEESGEWSLLLAHGELAKALQVLRQYQLENPRRPWQQAIPHSGLVFDWVSLGWVVLVVFFFQLDIARSLQPAGLMNSALVSRGEWWRLFTAMWLHADIAHLIANLTIGVILLGLAMGRYGTGTGLLAACLSGAAGNVFAGGFAALLHSEPHRSLGASGLVMGCLGLLAVQSFSTSGTPHRGTLKGVLAGILLFTILGLSPGSDLLAHFGGFIGGLAFGGILISAPRFAKSAATDRWSAFLVVVLLVLPWWLALRSTSAAP
jgi:rhomboid protease GluP